MWTPPKNVVKLGIPYAPYKFGQLIANVYVCISYSTGLPLFYSVIVCDNAINNCHNFLTFEEAMLFCDMNGYWIDTKDWDNPDIGIIKCYCASDKVLLEDGRVIEVGH